MRTPLHVVGPDEAAPVETVAERIRSLQAEARRLAKDHAGAFATAIADLQAMAEEINGGGEAYSSGVRSVAREVAQLCESRAKILETIAGRA